jgi:hypothetical protein
MKRNSSRTRATPFSPHPANVRTRRIFVIKRAGRLQATGTKSTVIQRVLIFDDHPDSLRLVFGSYGSSQNDETAQQRPRWWEPVLGWMLMICALLVLVLPLFLKLPS